MNNCKHDTRMHRPNLVPPTAVQLRGKQDGTLTGNGQALELMTQLDIEHFPHK